MKHYGLTEKFPILRSALRKTITKLLNLTDYKYQKSLISKIELLNEFQLVKYFTPNHVKNYFHDLQEELFSRIDLGFTELHLVGGHEDGGYVVPADFHLSSTWVTLGIGSHFDFEIELARSGCIVFGFDTNIGKAQQPLPSGLHFKKLNWSNEPREGCISLQDMLSEARINESSAWNMKIDIEGSEWKLLPEVLALHNRPKVIACELHDFIPRYGKSSFDRERVAVLRAFAEFYDVVFLKGNNYSPYLIEEDIGIYDAIEATFILKDAKSSKRVSPESKGLDIRFSNNDNVPLFTMGKLR
jgi:hypothetical protein